MRIVLLANPSPNQMALAHRVAQKLNLAGVVLEAKPPPKKADRTVHAFFHKAMRRTLAGSVAKTWKQLGEHYANAFGYNPPPVAVLKTNNVNSAEVAQFITDCRADVVMVSGTRIVRQPVLGLKLPKGIVNLHTGISPYIKGGPNCTNWCLATGKPELIGSTVMWLDAGIDTGNIIATEQAPLVGVQSFLELHIQVMDHAQDLYVRALEAMSQGLPLPNVPQADVGVGVTYYNRDWTLKWQLKTIANAKRLIRKELSFGPQPQLVSLPIAIA